MAPPDLKNLAEFYPEISYLWPPARPRPTLEADLIVNAEGSLIADWTKASPYHTQGPYSLTGFDEAVSIIAARHPVVAIMRSELAEALDYAGMPGRRRNVADNPEGLVTVIDNVYIYLNDTRFDVNVGIVHARHWAFPKSQLAPLLLCPEWYKICQQFSGFDSPAASIVTSLEDEPANVMEDAYLDPTAIMSSPAGTLDGLSGSSVGDFEGVGMGEDGGPAQVVIRWRGVELARVAMDTGGQDDDGRSDSRSLGSSHTWSSEELGSDESFVVGDGEDGIIWEGDEDKANSDDGDSGVGSSEEEDPEILDIEI